MHTMEFVVVILFIILHVCVMMTSCTLERIDGVWPVPAIVCEFGSARVALQAWLVRLLLLVMSYNDNSRCAAINSAAGRGRGRLGLPLPVVGHAPARGSLPRAENGAAAHGRLGSAEIKNNAHSCG